jgi:4-hydroxy-3-methylbut-2-en-1-yl diphosphate reductase
MKIFLANPRGFCAGVRRALTMLENAIEAFGIPLYVKHEIVHNDHIVDNLKQRGVIFVKEIEQVPPGANLVLSAHGSAREVFTKARDLGIKVIDATCPLVMKVHRNA